MVLLLNKDWMAVLEGRALALTGEEKELVFLQAYARVHAGDACWFDRWRAVTWGHGPEGVDERFKDGRLHGPSIKRGHDPEAVAREKTRKR